MAVNTEKNLFEWNDYKGYLRQQLDAAGARSGQRALFAKALNCQTSFISQVLHAEVNLSLEQACRTNDFLQHTPDQAHFFMLLVQRRRAGSNDLRAYFQKQIDAILAERMKIKSRVSANHELSLSEQSIYYSRPDYAVVHMALAAPAFQTAQDISHAFTIPLKRVDEIMQFLLSAGLAEIYGKGYRAGGAHMHLGSDSAFIGQHHTNWRLEALRRMEPRNPRHTHYSGVFTLAKADFARLQENILKLIEDNLKVVRPSPEEIVVCQNIDLFPLAE